jgi:hypothetical protein
MAFAFRANAMDMSFHRNPAFFSAPGALPASGLPMRGRMVDGQEALRALSHVELMALVSNRINQGRVRHWVSEKQVERLSAKPRDARIALFAGLSARHPAWANGAVGAFFAANTAKTATNHGLSALDNKHERAVYLGGSNIRKETGVNQSDRGRFPQDQSSDHPVAASTTFSN